MGTFTEAALGFPTVVFSAAVFVTVVFWLLVAVGAADGDAPAGGIGGNGG
ncbi:hypothetical protein G5C65_35130, partial [Streptomyces sp. SB3404]|nr:hypothetical protein [Streptomyces boncukensis]